MRRRHPEIPAGIHQGGNVLELIVVPGPATAVQAGRAAPPAPPAPVATATPIRRPRSHNVRSVFRVPQTVASLPLYDIPPLIPSSPSLSLPLFPISRGDLPEPQFSEINELDWGAPAHEERQNPSSPMNDDFPWPDMRPPTYEGLAERMAGDERSEREEAGVMMWGQREYERAERGERGMNDVQR